MLSSFSREDFSSWLLEGASTGDFSPVIPTIKSSVPTQIELLFDCLPSKTKTSMKAGLSQAIFEWKAEAYPVEALKVLITIATRIRVFSIVEILRVRIETNEFDPLPSVERFDLLQHIFAAIGGFAPHKQVKDFLERMFFYEEFDKRLLALVYIALLESSPKEFHRFTPRFLEISEKYPGFFYMDYVAWEMVRIVTLRNIAENISLLNDDVKVELLTLLCINEWSPAYLDVAHEGRACLSLREDFGNDAEKFDIISDIRRIKNDLDLVLYRVKLREVQRSGSPVASLKEKLLGAPSSTAEAQAQSW